MIGLCIQHNAWERLLGDYSMKGYVICYLVSEILDFLDFLFVGYLSIGLQNSVVMASTKANQSYPFVLHPFMPLPSKKGLAFLVK